jgi:hypothetical protein
MFDEELKKNGKGIATETERRGETRKVKVVCGKILSVTLWRTL